MIEFESVELRRSHRFALRDFSLQVPTGRVTALIGPSGSGKSTVLRLAAGLLQPEQGRILFAGRALNFADKGGSLLRIRHRIGYVLQEGGLFPHMSVQSNIVLMARQLGWSQERIELRLKELLVLTRLSANLLDSRPGQLSGGERQRVSVLRALMLDPEVLLLDEPLGALDPMVRYELQAELKLLFRQLAKSVLLVTHDIAEAAYLADTLVLMREGRVVQSGEFSTLAAAPCEPFVTEFLSAYRSPPPVLAPPLKPS
jgi:osmoprotectant transport system ATP-binding protein